MSTHIAAAPAFAALFLAACVTPSAIPPVTQSAPLSPPTVMAAADVFLAQLGTLCGQAFEGRMISADPVDAGTPWATERVVMHVRDCSPEEVRIPLHVGEDRSRTWVLTRTPDGVRLKHDHRHEDGTPDVLTMYGGDSTGPTGFRRDFPTDAESKALFVQEGIPASAENIWSMTLWDGTFTYTLSRPNRDFRVAFDLARPVAPPPPPWGADTPPSP